MNADHDRALRDFPVACIIFILSQILDVCTFGNLTLVKARKFTLLTRSTSGFHKNFKMVRKEKFTSSFIFYLFHPACYLLHYVLITHC